MRRHRSTATKNLTKQQKAAAQRRALKQRQIRALKRIRQLRKLQSRQKALKAQQKSAHKKSRALKKVEDLKKARQRQQELARKKRRNAKGATSGGQDIRTTAKFKTQARRSAIVVTLIRLLQRARALRGTLENSNAGGDRVTIDQKRRLDASIAEVKRAVILALRPSGGSGGSPGGNAAIEASGRYQEEGAAGQREGVPKDPYRLDPFGSSLAEILASELILGDAAARGGANLEDAGRHGGGSITRIVVARRTGGRDPKWRFEQRQFDQDGNERTFHYHSETEPGQLNDGEILVNEFEIPEASEIRVTTLRDGRNFVEYFDDEGNPINEQGEPVPVFGAGGDTKDDISQAIAEIEEAVQGLKQEADAMGGPGAEDLSGGSTTAGDKPGSTGGATTGGASTSGKTDDGNSNSGGGSGGDNQTTEQKDKDKEETGTDKETAASKEKDKEKGDDTGEGGQPAEGRASGTGPYGGASAAGAAQEALSRTREGARKPEPRRHEFTDQEQGPREPDPTEQPEPHEPGAASADGVGSGASGVPGTGTSGEGTGLGSRGQRPVKKVPKPTVYPNTDDDSESAPALGTRVPQGSPLDLPIGPDGPGVGQ